MEHELTFSRNTLAGIIGIKIYPKFYPNFLNLQDEILSY